MHLDHTGEGAPKECIFIKKYIALQIYFQIAMINQLMLYVYKI